MSHRYQSLNLIHYLRNEALSCNQWNSNRSTYLQHRFDISKKLNCQNENSHSGCVNALDFSSDGLFLASGFKNENELFSTKKKKRKKKNIKKSELNIFRW